MAPDYRGRSNVGVIMYLLFKFAAVFWAAVTELSHPVTVGIFLALFLAGTAFLLYGCWAQTKMKNQPTVLALLGLFELPGLIVLAVLPERTRKSAPQAVV